ncbi:MAG: hypothetical protein U0L49_07270 [Eubacterium sp.]|nr:hypothetical protein [Eubacterium sp.]
MYIQRIQDIFQSLTKQQTQIEKKLRQLPEGKLLINSNGIWSRWHFKPEDGKRIYLPKTEKDLAEKLAAKSLYLLQAAYIGKETRILKQFLDIHNEYSEKRKTLDEKPGFQELINGYENHFSKKQKKWIEEEYTKNPNYPEQLIVKTTSGEFVRSKSEMLIANALYKNQVPYRYECILQLDNGSIYFPDFTILHPDTKEIYYWEHFGLFDRPGYREKACRKIMDYAGSKIYPSVNLIMTFETADHPFNAEQAGEFVKYYFG